MDIDVHHLVVRRRCLRIFAASDSRVFPGVSFLENYRHGGRFWGSIFLREDFSILVHT